MEWEQENKDSIKTPDIILEKGRLCQRIRNSKRGLFTKNPLNATKTINSQISSISPISSIIKMSKEQ